ncbi:MAG: hypothetical protein AAF250_07055 [Pseudomonadota bacterium]
MKLFEGDGVFQRQAAFLILVAPAIGLMLMLEVLGAPSDLAVGFAFIPTLAIYVWSKRSSPDRFLGLENPALIFALSLSLGGYAQYKSGALFEALYLAGATGLVISMGWLLWYWLFLGGPARKKKS